MKWSGAAAVKVQMGCLQDEGMALSSKVCSLTAGLGEDPAGGHFCQLQIIMNKCCECLHMCRHTQWMHCKEPKHCMKINGKFYRRQFGIFLLLLFCFKVLFILEIFFHKTKKEPTLIWWQFSKPHVLFNYDIKCLVPLVFQQSPSAEQFHSLWCFTSYCDQRWSAKFCVCH